MAKRLCPSSSSTSTVGERSNILHCFVCMEPPTKPVAGVCGHVFCWSCLHQWLANGPKPCPTCRHTLDKDQNLIRLYGGGEESANEENVEKPPPCPRNLMLFLDSITVQGDTTIAEYRKTIMDLCDAYSQQSVALDEETNRVQYLERQQGILHQHVHYMTVKTAELRGERTIDAWRMEALEKKNAELREQTSRIFDLQMEKGSLELREKNLEQRNMDLLLARYEEAKHVKTLLKEQKDKVFNLQMEKDSLELRVKDLGQKNMDLLLTTYEEVRRVKSLLGEQTGKVFDLQMERNAYELQVDNLQRQNFELAVARDREALCVKALQAEISRLVKEKNQVEGNGVEGSAGSSGELDMAINSEMEPANNLQEGNSDVSEEEKEFVVAQCCEAQTYLEALCKGLESNSL